MHSWAVYLFGSVPSMKILIIKSSSLGDIIQSFPALNYLRRLFPECEIDWVVEEHLAAVVQAHPLIRRAIAIPLQKIKRRCFSMHAWKDFFASMRDLRKETYRWVFDLQGNCKSALLTFLSRGDLKIGFDLFSVREWPNVLATKARFFVPKEMNIRLQYLSLMQQFFRSPDIDFEQAFQGVEFCIDDDEKALLLPYSLKRHTIMVCPGSKWVNKQLPLDTWVDFLNRIGQTLETNFLLVWGSLEEKEYCEAIQKRCPKSHVLEMQLKIPAWQYLMNRMDLLIAVDSSALHLCGTTKTASFSIFGPTSALVFRPPGKHHFALQGECPYGKVFLKQCPMLRTCPTGACIRELRAEVLFAAWQNWIQKSKTAAKPDSPVAAL